MPNKNPRLTITLPSGVNRALEWWAKQQGNKASSLVSSLVETAIRDAVEAGVIPMSVMAEKEAREPSIDSGTKADLEEFLKLLAAGDCPDDGKLILLAHALDIDAEILIDLCNQVNREGSTNGV